MSESPPISPHVIIEINNHVIDYSKSSPLVAKSMMNLEDEDQENPLCEKSNEGSVMKKVFKTFFNFKILLDEQLMV